MNRSTFFSFFRKL